MATSDIAEAVEALRSAVDVLKANPEILHTDELSFFKEYLQSLGAKLPPHGEQKKAQEKKPVKLLAALNSNSIMHIICRDSSVYFVYCIM